MQNMARWIVDLKFTHLLRDIHLCILRSIETINIRDVYGKYILFECLLKEEIE